MNLWHPTQAQIDQALITQFSKQHSIADNNYQALHQWSIDQTADFWSAVWDFCGVVGHKGEAVLGNGKHVTEQAWFSNAKLNYAENLLHAKNQKPCITFYGEDKVSRSLAHEDLVSSVSQCQQALVSLGVNKGDRVVGVLPNSIEAIIAMLATVSLGAIWSSASPDFGADGLLDRFEQISPKVLFCVDGYFYNGKWINCQGKNTEVHDSLTTEQNSELQSLEVSAIEVSYHADSNSQWSQLLAQFTPKEVTFERVCFDHPLFILFSSGTTGQPKCIIHGHGGTLLQHLKEHQLHSNIQAMDRLFYFTTCGWMMWNWQVSALASGADLVLYDGNPFAGSPDVLFDIVANEKVTHFGTSAKYIEACNKAQLAPNETHDLTALRTLFSTGSPLAPESFRYVYSNVKNDVHLASISGGTDIISCFALGNPTQSVFIGELQCLGLGMDVAAFDDNGMPTPTGNKGDLVCRNAFPAMPIGFWNDPDKQKYLSAYFQHYDNVWCHGDYIELSQHPEQKHSGMIIHGRSDAVLNPGGVRIGTAEIYRQVEKLETIIESVVIGQQWQNDVRVVLFIKLAQGHTLTSDLIKDIKHHIRANATPRHVPSVILSVDDIPRTKSGKIVELAVRDVIHGREVKNKTSLANPEALELFKALVPELNS